MRLLKEIGWLLAVAGVFVLVTLFTVTMLEDADAQPLPPESHRGFIRACDASNECVLFRSHVLFPSFATCFNATSRVALAYGAANAALTVQFACAPQTREQFLQSTSTLQA